MATKAYKKLNSINSDEHDLVEYRKRVATHIDGNVLSYEDTNFVAADDGSVLDVESDLNRDSGVTAHRGYFINDGPGDILLEISADGTSYGGQHTIRGGDVVILDDLKISKIRLSHVDDTEYRCLIG